MERTLSSLIRMRVQATDAHDAGRVRDLLLDPHSWVVRYLILDTGGFLERDEHLISPLAVQSIFPEEERIELNLTRDKLERAPHLLLPATRTFTRNQEADYHVYFGWPFYWGAPGAWQPVDIPISTSSNDDDALKEPSAVSGDLIELVSFHDLQSYSVRAGEHEFGRVRNAIFSEPDFVITHLVADLRRWFSDRAVSLPVACVRQVDKGERRLLLSLGEEEIRSAPEFTLAGVAYVSSGYLEKVARHFHMT